MRIFQKVMVVGFLSCLALPGYAADNEEVKKPESCEIDDEKVCMTPEDEEALDRGFDPCLINAALPACPSAEKKPVAEAVKEPPKQD